MAEVAFELLHSFIKPYVPACSNVVINSHLARAASDFCKRTKIWRLDIADDVTVANTKDYLIAVPVRTKLEDILDLNIDENEINRVSDRLEPIEISSDASQPDSYSIYNDDYVRFYPIPNAVYTFNGVMVIKPSLAATGLEGFIHETYGRIISYGAIASLLDIPQKEWSDPSLALNYWDRFENGIISTKTRDSRKVKRRTKAVFF